MHTVISEQQGATSGDATGRGSGGVLAAAVLGFVVIALDALVVNVALPQVGRDLGGGITGLQWVVDGYTLAFAACMLSAGALSDRIGADRAFTGGLALFTAASVACGAAGSIAVLVAARLVQGLAASLVMPASLALVRQTYADAARRTRAIATWTAGGAIATTIGPVAGGLLTSAWSWRLIFLINVPIGITGVLLAARSRRSGRRSVPLDLRGQVLGVVSLAALTVGTIEGGALTYEHPLVVASYGVAALAAVGFFTVEARSPHPAVPLTLFKVPAVAVAVAAGFAINVAWYGSIFLLSLSFQTQLDQEPLTAGLMFVPTTALVAASNLFVAARAIQRFGPRLPMVLGQAGTVVGLAVLLATGSDTHPLLVALAAVPVGLAGALAVPALTGLVLDEVPASLAGTAAGVLNTVRQAGGAVAVAVFGALVAGRRGFVDGERWSLLVAGLLLGLTSVLTLVVLPSRRSD